MSKKSNNIALTFYDVKFNTRLFYNLVDVIHAVSVLLDSKLISARFANQLIIKWFRVVK